MRTDTQLGITSKIKLQGCSIYCTLTRTDKGQPHGLFVSLKAESDKATIDPGHKAESDKATIDPGHKAWVRLAATLAGELFKRGCSIETVARKFKGYNFAPHGKLGPGGAKSIPDAIGRWLQDQAGEQKEGAKE